MDTTKNVIMQWLRKRCKHVHNSPDKFNNAQIFPKGVKQLTENYLPILSSAYSIITRILMYSWKNLSNFELVRTVVKMFTPFSESLHDDFFDCVHQYLVCSHLNHWVLYLFSVVLVDLKQTYCHIWEELELSLDKSKPFRWAQHWCTPLCV